MPYVSSVKTLSVLVAHGYEEAFPQLWDFFFTDVEKLLHSRGESINVSSK